jgi:hypothetical protein
VTRWAQDLLVSDALKKFDPTRAKATLHESIRRLNVQSLGQDPDADEKDLDPPARADRKMARIKDFLTHVCGTFEDGVAFAVSGVSKQKTGLDIELLSKLLPEPIKLKLRQDGMKAMSAHMQRHWTPQRALACKTRAKLSRRKWNMIRHFVSFTCGKDHGATSAWHVNTIEDVPVPVIPGRKALQTRTDQIKLDYGLVQANKGMSAYVDLPKYITKITQDSIDSGFFKINEADELVDKNGEPACVQTVIDAANMHMGTFSCYSGGVFLKYLYALVW